jgi:hypothetical protein
VLDEDKATATWIQFEAVQPDSIPNMLQSETEAPVLFVLPMINPAHALSDALFSIALDNFSSRPKSHYCADHYFLANHAPVDGNYGSNNWCQFMHHKLNIVSPEAELFADTDKKGETLFFRHLLMPKYMRHRFAADWGALAPCQPGGYIDQSEGLYPLDVLLEMRRRLFRNCFDSVPSRNLTEQSLLIYDRGDTHRRRWSNAGETVNMIRNTFSNRFSSIQFLSEDYGNLSPLEQAWLFHDSSVVISPHGGALSNLIFCRPGTRVIEFTDQISPWGWFTFCSRLGMEHIQYKPPSLVEHYPEQFEVQPEEIRHLLEALV